MFLKNQQIIYMFIDVEYNGKKFTIFTIYFKKQRIPVLIDENNKNLIQKFGAKWKCNSSGIITTNYIQNNIVHTIKLHKLIFMKEYPYDKKHVFHINKMRIDNREENLNYMTKKNILNTKKRKRRLQLPENSDIQPNEIPSYVWYSKSEGTHGDRFIIKLKNLFWKSTSSKKVSLRYKLEETKNYLRLLKKEKPELFENLSMNGDYNKKGEELINSFYNIIYKAGFNHIKRISIPNNTRELLDFDKLPTSIEKKIFSKNISKKKLDNSKKIIKISPNDKFFKNINLPDHVYYRPETNIRGNYFLIKNHPKYNRVWTTTTSKNVSVIEKYQQLMDFLNSL